MSSRAGGRDDEELLALARSLPEPVLSEERREEMRTAFLSTARGRRSGEGSETGFLGRRRRLLLIGAVMFAGAGAAAAAWRIGFGPSSARRDPVSARLVVPEESGRVVPAPVPPPRTTVASEKSPPVSRPRRLSLATRRGEGPQDTAKEIEVAFARGWSALRTGGFDEAAEAFARAASGRPSALAEDALFWQGVALDRAGRFAPAHDVLIDFLARYPSSDRRGEAAVIVGWLVLHAGDPTEARQYFQRGLQDTEQRVRNSARAGLSAARNVEP